MISQTKKTKSPNLPDRNLKEKTSSPKQKLEFFRWSHLGNKGKFARAETSTYSKVGGFAPVQVGTLSPLIYGFLKVPSTRFRWFLGTSVINGLYVFLGISFTCITYHVSSSSPVHLPKVILSSKYMGSIVLLADPLKWYHLQFPFQEAKWYFFLKTTTNKNLNSNGIQTPQKKHHVNLSPHRAHPKTVWI